MLYAVGEGIAPVNLMALPTSGDGKPIRIVSEPIQHAQFSPDGRWIAYSSAKSGRLEVYVVAFPTGTPQGQVSNNGGEQPRWAGRAGELIYLAPNGKLMAVPVKMGATFDAGTPTPLFNIRTNLVNQRHQYAVSTNGQRFLVSALVGDVASQSSMTVVFNWPALLKK